MALHLPDAGPAGIARRPDDGIIEPVRGPVG